MFFHKCYEIVIVYGNTLCLNFSCFAFGGIVLFYKLFDVFKPLIVRYTYFETDLKTLYVRTNNCIHTTLRTLRFS